MPSATTVPVPSPSVPHGPLAHFLANPGGWLANLGRYLAHLGGSAARIGLPVLVVIAAGLLVALAVWACRRLRRPATGSQVEIRVPIEADPKGALTFWRHLHPVLAGRGRVFGPRRHVAFELRSHDGEVQLGIWTPAEVSPHAVARAVESAWPGARCTVGHAGRPRARRSPISFGELRLARPAWFALGTEHGTDPLRTVLATLGGGAVGEHGVVQILVRPAPSHRVAGLGRAARSLHAGRPTATVPRLLAAWRTTPAAPVRSDPMRSADVRQTVAKATDFPLFEVTIRYGLFGPDAGRRRRRGHEVAAAFGVYAAQNHLTKRHPLGCARRLQRREVNRGDLMGVTEVAALAHLPWDGTAPGLVHAGTALVAPPAGLSSTGSAWEADDDLL